MIKNLVIYSLLSLVAFGLAMSSVDVVCLLLWQLQPGASALQDHDHFPAHHPDAPDAHSSGADDVQPLSVLLLSTFIDDARGVNSLDDELDSFVRMPLLNINSTHSEPPKNPIERPPQTLS